MKHFWKRLTAMVAALMLLCTCALAQDGTLLGEEDGGYVWIRMTATVGDTLYAVKDNHLYSYQLGQADVTDLGVVDCAQDYGNPSDEKAISETPDYQLDFLSSGERLVSVNPWNGRVFELTVQDGKVNYQDLATLKETDFLYEADGDSRYPNQIQGAIALGDQLHVLVQGYDDEGWTRNMLYTISLTDGTVTASSQQFINQMTAYKDGKLLVSVLDEANSWNEETGKQRPAELDVWDPAADTLTKLADAPTNSTNVLCWDSTKDRLVYFDNCRIMGWNLTDEPKQLSYAPAQWLNGMAVLGDTVVLISSDTGIVLRTLQDDFNSDVSLTLYGGWMDNGVIRFAAQNPSVPVYTSEAYYDTSESLAQAMVGGADTIDVLQMSVSYSNFLQLKAKGYCADLSGYPELVKAVENMQPAIKDAVMQDGKVVAIPVNFGGWGMAVNLNVLEDMGLTMDDMPTNYVELCQFITKWNDEYLDEYPEYLPMELYGGSSVKRILFSNMVSDYLYYCQAKNEDVRFDTPIFREMMQALDDMRCDDIDSLLEEIGDSDSFWEKQFAITTGYPTVGSFDYYEGGSGYDAIRPLFMKLTADADQTIGGDLTVMFLNPRSKNLDYAAQLLQCELEAMDVNVKYTLDTTMTEPVEQENFGEMLKTWQDNLDSLKKSRDEAPEDEKRNYDESIDYMQKLIDNQETYRYTISEKALAYFKENVAPYLYVQQPTFLNSSSSDKNAELQTLLDRYTAGQINTEQFIKEADKKLRMMQMEDY